MKPLFVVGAPRSGTTLVRNLLRSLAGVYLPPDEFQVLKTLVSAVESNQSPQRIARMLDATTFAMHMRRRRIWPTTENLAELLTDKSAADAFRDLVLEIAEMEGIDPVMWWGDKTPETVFQLNLVARLWPDVQVLHVQRDPRATVLSMYTSWGRSLTRSAVIWRDAIRAGNAFKVRCPSQYQVVEFETLTADPLADMVRIGAWLSVDFDPEKLKTVTSEERWGGAAGSVGVIKRTPDWQKKLTQSQIQLIEEICFDEMRLCGIEPLYATHSRTPGKVLQKALKINDTARILQSYAKERGWRKAVAYKVSQWRNTTS